MLASQNSQNDIIIKLYNNTLSAADNSTSAIVWRLGDFPV